MKTNLSDDELKSLINLVSVCMSKDDYGQAYIHLSKTIDILISEDKNLPFLLNYRASISSIMHNWDLAIFDIQKCISISPYDSSYYLSMGVYITWKYFYTGSFRIDNVNQDLKESIYYYKECLRLDPTHCIAWLNTIETYLFLMEWDNALGYLGMSKPFLSSKENMLIWSWLTCLSLALIGDPIEHEDIKLLLDDSIKYDSSHDYKQIDCTISELERIQYNTARLKRAKEIHQLYKLRIGVIK